MFGVDRNRILWKVCVSCMETTSTMKYSMRVNAGARRRLNLNEEKESDPENLDYEADFSSINRSHKQHTIEMEMLREKLQYDIVKQKYFKTKYPNFLTWHDKEQIRLLHRKDPEEWNVTKLSEGFPALPEIIKKVVRSDWRKQNVNKIKNHDASVLENWKKFKNNEFDNLSEELVEHLKKFSERDLSFYDHTNQKANTVQFNTTRKGGTFSEIITSYEELKNKQKCESSNTVNQTIALNNNMIKHQAKYDTYVDGQIKNNRLITLDSLKNKLQKDVERGKQVSYTDISIAEMREVANNVVEKPTVSHDQLDSVKYNTGRIMVIDEKKTSDYDHLVYPEKINIPKKILKKGYTYKLNDCYYDSDGTFLYRVPGMY